MLTINCLRGSPAAMKMQPHGGDECGGSRYPNGSNATSGSHRTAPQVSYLGGDPSAYHSLLGMEQITPCCNIGGVGGVLICVTSMCRCEVMIPGVVCQAGSAQLMPCGPAVLCRRLGLSFQQLEKPSSAVEDRGRRHDASPFPKCGAALPLSVIRARRVWAAIAISSPEMTKHPT